MILSQLIVNGLIAGSLYALVAAGFSLIYSTSRFLHLAHGAVVAASAYLLYAFFSLFGLPFALSAILAVVGTALIGALLYCLVYRPLQIRHSSNAILLIASVGLLILGNNLFVLMFGPDAKVIDTGPVGVGHELFGAVVTTAQLLMIALSLVLFVALWVFIRYAPLGKTIRAVADNPELAAISGINSVRIQLFGFVLGSAVAGVAGIFAALEQNVDPYMGVSLIVNGFTGAVVGGVSSVPGAILGSYILGLVENLGIWYLPSGFKGGIAFGLLLLVLLVRPAGILGIRKGIKQ